jgi:hypothetical protein
MDKFTKQLLGTKTQQDVTPNGFNQPRSRFYNSTIRNYWEQGGALAPIIPHPYESKGTPIYRDTTDSSLFENGGELLAQPYPNSFFASDLGNYYANGGYGDPPSKSKSKPPIYTSNPYDPRIKAYRDSTVLHNLGEAELKRFFKGTPPKSDDKIRSSKDLDKVWSEVNKMESRKGRLYDYNKSLALGANSAKRLKKISDTFKKTGNLPTDFWINEGFLNYRFKKPKQPVYYKEQGVINPVLAEPEIIEPAIVETVQPQNTQPIQIPLRDEMVLPYGRSYHNVGKDGRDEGGKQGYARFEKVMDPTSGKVRYLPKSGKAVEFTTLMDPTFKQGGRLNFADGGPLHDRDNTTGKLLNSTYASVLGSMFRDGGYFDRGYSLPEDSFRQGGRGLKDSIYASTSGQYPATYRQGGSILSMSNTPQLEGEGKDLNYPSKGYAYGSGGMLKRADGSYSQRGLWDNIRANRGSGKEPTKEMLRQERKIRNEKAFGGVITTSQLPQANYFDNGGKPKNPKLITYKTDSKLIDGTAAFDLISKVPISDDYNQQIKERLYTGKWGFDPESGALVKLNKSQQTTIPQNITNIRKEEKITEEERYRQIKNEKINKQQEIEYLNSIKQAGFNPSTFGGSYLPKTEEYKEYFKVGPRSTQELQKVPVEEWTKEEMDNWAREGYNATMFNPLFSTAAYFTPAGIAIGAIQGAANLIPDLYEGDYGYAAMDVASMLPFAGPLARRAVYNAIEPAGYGVANKLKSAPKTFVKNILDPKGRPERVGKELLKGVAEYTPEEAITMGQNRLDAWRVGLKMPQKYDTFEEIAENTYRIKNMKPATGRLSAIDKDIQAYELAKQKVGTTFNTQEELNSKLQKLYQQHDDIVNPTSLSPSPGEFDVNYLKKYLRKSGDIKTPEWQQARIVEKSLQPEFKHSVYDVDPQGIMGSYRWDVKKDPSGALHYQSNDTWDLNPWENRGHTKVNPNQEETNVLKKHFKRPLQNIEALSLVGGKPFKIQNNFAVNPQTFEVIGKWEQGGKMHNAPVLTTSMLLKRFK